MEMRRDMRACTQDEAPPCKAGCPLHVDVKAMLEHLQQGGFAAAFSLYQSSAVFPRLLGRFCEAPCETVCNRGKQDEAVAIRLLEEFICRHDETPLSPPGPFMELSDSVGLVGGGISSLCAALVLYEKGFSVTLYEQAPRLGGRGWQLDEERARGDFSFLEAIPWQVKTGVRREGR